MNQKSKKKDNELYKFLVCPISRNTLKYNENTQELISESAAVAFPIKNGVPILLIDEARKLD